MALLCTEVHGTQYPCVKGAQIPGARAAGRLSIFTVATNICGSSLLNFILVIQLALRILRWLLDFWKILC